jgi:hypothetical protein
MKVAKVMINVDQHCDEGGKGNDQRGISVNKMALNGRS